MRFAVLALSLALLLAGCAGSSKPTSISPSNPPLGFGSLIGTVYDGEQIPVPQVRVEVRGPADERDLLTGPDGSYMADDLIEGTYVVKFVSDRHEPASTIVAVPPGQETEQDAILDLKPELRPYKRILSPLRGYYDCGLEAVILTGDCMILWENATGEEDPATREAQMLSFQIGTGWEKIVAEITWTSGANNQLEGMRLYLAPGNESASPDEHHTKLAVAEGDEQPLRIDLVSGTPHPTAEAYPESSTKAQIPSTGGPVFALAYPRGKMADTAGGVCQPDDPDRCFLGVGVGVGIEFTLYVAAFFNGEPVPTSFTMVPQ